MSGTDKYVVIFAVGVILLVVAALAVSSMQPENTFMEGEGPEAVAFNYLLSLEQGDYERAYAYLSPDLKGYPPDENAFARDVRNDPWMFPSERSSTSLTLLSVEERNGRADAGVRVTSNFSGGLFGLNRNTDTIDLRLEQTDDGWKIVGGDRLFIYCWSSGDCP